MRYEAGIRNHALLYSMFAREIMTVPGGESLLERAVERYGLERGGRMAQRARKDGLPTTVGSYLLYGEWKAKPGETELAIRAYEPEVNLQNRKCPWLSHWLARGEGDLGKSYCVVDAFLAKGFNPEIVLQLTGHLTEGECCDFYFRGCSLTPRQQETLARNRAVLGDRGKKDWNYHVGHLYSALVRTMREALDPETAQTLEERAMNAYRAEFGDDAARAAHDARDAEYATTDDYEGTEGLEK